MPRLLYKAGKRGKSELRVLPSEPGFRENNLSEKWYLLRLLR